jgi:hypothetical protein
LAVEDVAQLLATAATVGGLLTPRQLLGGATSPVIAGRAIAGRGAVVVFAKLLAGAAIVVPTRVIGTTAILGSAAGVGPRSFFKGSAEHFLPPAGVRIGRLILSPLQDPTPGVVLRSTTTGVLDRASP